MAWVLPQEGSAGIHAAQVQGAAQVRPVHSGLLWRRGCCGPGEPILEAERAQHRHEAEEFLQCLYGAQDITICIRKHFRLRPRPSLKDYVLVALRVSKHTCIYSLAGGVDVTVAKGAEHVHEMMWQVASHLLS